MFPYKHISYINDYLKLSHKQWLTLLQKGCMYGKYALSALKSHVRKLWQQQAKDK